MFEIAPHGGVGVAAALATGLTGSLHCALMCGPLACSPLPASGATGRTGAIAGWHVGRLLAYGVVGLALGVAGDGLARALASRVMPILPWVMVVGLVATAFELGRRVPALPIVSALARRVATLGAGASPFGRAVGLGAATPFLPCGLLWGVFLVAVGAGSALGGAVVMLAFVAASTPGLAAVQLGTAWAGRWPRAERVLRVAVPLLAAVVVAWRALAIGDPALGMAGHDHAH